MTFTNYLINKKICTLTHIQINSKSKSKMSKKLVTGLTGEKRKRIVYEDEDNEPQPGPSSASSLIPSPNTLRQVAVNISS